MALHESNRPDFERVRALAGRRAEAASRPDCCDPYCWTCPGSGPDRQEGSRAGRGRGIRLPERDASQPPKDPRFAWLPP